MTVISAELGLNHGGDLETALRMVEAAAGCGADAVKVQAQRPGDFLPEGHPDWAMFDQCQLSWDAMAAIRDRTWSCGMKFGATPTSVGGVRLLAAMGVDFLKNGSDFLPRLDVIEAMADTGIETWVATGMAYPADLDDLPPDVLLMACTSAYHCPDEEANLARLAWCDGYSDHTLSLLTGALACALGAEMYETHFTLFRDAAGPDHAISRAPDELELIVRRVRQTEKLLGSPDVAPTPSELVNRDKWRVSLEKPVRS